MKKAQPDQRRLLTFEALYNKFREKNGCAPEQNNDIGKIRDKFTEIVDAVGIDKELLRASKKLTAVGGGTIKKGAYMIPEDSLEFCVDVIGKYTSKDFKSLRSAEFRDVSAAELQFLIEGFACYLHFLGYPDECCRMQYHKMDRRMHYKIRISEQILEEGLGLIKNQALEYESSVVNFNYDDSIYFIRYMAQKVKNLADYLDEVYGNYTDTRSEELSNMAMEEARNESPGESMAKVNMELQLGYELEHDKEYQKIAKDIEKLVAEDAFIKLKQGRYQKMQKRMAEIREAHQIELFGRIIEEEKSEPIRVRHPLDVLGEAVEYTEGNIQDRLERQIEQDKKTPEDLKKEREEWERIKEDLEKRGFDLHFDLPDTSEEEEVVFMRDGIKDHKLKGMIPFPCCPKEKVMVYEGTSGETSVKCPNCGSYSLFDFKRMTSERGHAIRGASHRFTGEQAVSLS